MIFRCRYAYAATCLLRLLLMSADTVAMPLECVASVEADSVRVWRCVKRRRRSDMSVCVAAPQKMMLLPPSFRRYAALIFSPYLPPRFHTADFQRCCRRQPRHTFSPPSACQRCVRARVAHACVRVRKRCALICLSRVFRVTLFHAA